MVDCGWKTHGKTIDSLLICIKWINSLLCLRRKSKSHHHTCRSNQELSNICRERSSREWKQMVIAVFFHWRCRQACVCINTEITDREHNRKSKAASHGVTLTRKKPRRALWGECRLKNKGVWAGIIREKAFCVLISTDLGDKLLYTLTNMFYQIKVILSLLKDFIPIIET